MLITCRGEMRNIFWIILIMAFAERSVASPIPKDLSPADCRWRCEQPEQGGWCLHLNKNGKGVRSAVEPFLWLNKVARSPQTYLYCGQRVDIGSQKFSMSGPSCVIEQRGVVEEVIRTTLPGDTIGEVFRLSSGNVELIFGQDPPLWMVDVFSPSIGENPVVFITDGHNTKGVRTTIWFDRYFCYSIEQD